MLIITPAKMDAEEGLTDPWHYLPFLTHSSFRLSGFKHLVSLHHATIGEAAIIFIILATPRE